MSPFALFAICIEVCLIQAAFGQRACSSNIGLSNVNLAPRTVNTNLATGSVVSSGNYGGVGIGEMAALGEATACGETAMVGSVPTVGQAGFCGTLPAAGSVSVAGQCGCGRT